MFVNLGGLTAGFTNFDRSCRCLGSGTAHSSLKLESHTGFGFK